MKLECYAREEHVGVIERSTRQVKERSRSTCQGLPYKRYPELMVKELQAGIINGLNMFPKKMGVNKRNSGKYCGWQI